jgi:hypothetical protein
MCMCVCVVFTLREGAVYLLSFEATILDLLTNLICFLFSDCAKHIALIESSELDVRLLTLLELLARHARIVEGPTGNVAKLIAAAQGASTLLRSFIQSF